MSGAATACTGGGAPFLLAAGLAAVSAAGVWLSIRVARRAGVMDVPNARSSHTIPTPRMGGVPMVATIGAAAILALSLSGKLSPGSGVARLVLYATGMAALGFWDDLSSLSPRFRFVVQFLGALPVLWPVAEAVRSLPWLPAGPAAGLLAVGACAFWVVWMLNLYNFMDGIDGLAGGEALVASTFFFLVFTRHGAPEWAFVNLCVAAAAAGFLVFNWSPAKVFMGDAGSAFLGAFFGLQSVLAALVTPVPFPVLVLPFANFILDTTVTLVRRFLRGEKWYLAHRSHHYQRMTGLGMPHAAVAAAELASALACCAAAAAYLRSGAVARAAVVAAVLSLFVAAGVAVQRKEERAREKQEREMQKT